MPPPSARSPLLTASILVFALTALPAHGAPPQAAPESAAVDEIVRLTSELMAPITAASHARDSLSQLASRTDGAARDVLEEQIWQRNLELHAGLVAAATRLDRLRRQGRDISAARRMLDEAVSTGWPRYEGQLERRNQMFRLLFESRDASAGSQRLAIESQLTSFVERTARMYEALVEALLALEKLEVDVASQRAWAVEQITIATGQTKARMTVLDRERSLATSRVQRTPDDATARAELDAVELGMQRSVGAFETEIALLARLGQDVTSLKVDLIVATGTLTSAALEPRVILGLLKHGQARLLDTLASRLPHWLFQVLLFVAIFAGFRVLANATRRATRRLVQKAELSQLMRDTIANWSSKLVMTIALVVLLRQMGFQVGPMLAGVGIAGVVVGLALQDTLSNFAAGAMILAYQPFDVGDTIGAAGVEGTVKKMSLVSTTILTLDNQTLIIPNKKVWGDVIRNITAQQTRRVDLLFSVAYESDIEQVERVLQGIVEADPRVLKNPAPLVKLHQLAESSVNYVVRLWTAQEHYWDVYWDTTRAVKLSFDREGIEIPYPQREVHMSAGDAASAPGGGAGGTTRPGPPPSS